MYFQHRNIKFSVVQRMQYFMAALYSFFCRKRDRMSSKCVSHASQNTLRSRMSTLSRTEQQNLNLNKNNYSVSFVMRLSEIPFHICCIGIFSFLLVFFPSLNWNLDASIHKCMITNEHWNFNHNEDAQSWVAFIVDEVCYASFTQATHTPTNGYLIRSRLHSVAVVLKITS